MSWQTDRSTALTASIAALLCLVLTAVRANPPAAREPADDGSFSAVRAQRILENLYAGDLRHPIGSENNRRLKERILDHLRQIGFEPTVQSTLACRESGGCGHVDNILARLEGTGGGKAVLLAVHYDGVGAGPSVSDDGVAVAATLEIARILKSGPPLANDVIFLIDDGEEAFLLGAAAFAAKHPWAEDVGAIVNLEARGTGGRSYMFETGTDNGWLIELMKQHVPRPATSSLYYAIYQRLPNDTDFTVFKFHGMNGVNFAFIQDVVHYHTPLDDLAHVTPGSLQHHGENALGMVRGLGKADLVSPPTGTASWFDVWGFGLVSWPETWNLPLAILSLLLFIIATGTHARRGDFSAIQIRAGMVVFPGALLTALLLALATVWILVGVGQLPSWPATSWAPQAAFWMIALASGSLWVSTLGRKAGAIATWLGAIFWLATLALLTSLLLPGAAYLFLVPALIGASVTLASAFWTAPWIRRVGVALTLIGAGATLWIMAWSLWDAMGIPVMPVVALFVTAISTLALAPSAKTLRRTGLRASLAGFVLAGLLVAASLVLPAYSDESPRPLNFYFVQDADKGRARLAVRPNPRPLPDSMMAAIDWNDSLQPFYPWDENDPAFLTAEVPAIAVSPPEIEVLDRQEAAVGTQIRARLLSPRQAARGALVFQQPDRIESLRLEGWDFDLQTDEIRAWYPDGRRVVRFATMPPEGIEFELTLTGSDPFEVFLVDYSFDLPAAGDPLITNRPSNMVPIGQGDLTIVHTRAVL